MLQCATILTPQCHISQSKLLQLHPCHSKIGLGLGWACMTSWLFDEIGCRAKFALQLHLGKRDLGSDQFMSLRLLLEHLELVGSAHLGAGLQRPSYRHKKISGFFCC